MTKFRLSINTKIVMLIFFMTLISVFVASFVVASISERWMLSSFYQQINSHSIDADNDDKARLESSIKSFKYEVLYQTITSSMLIAGLAFLVGYLVTFFITRPIAPMIKFATRLAEGDLHTESNKLLFPNDDVGTLSNALLTLQRELIAKKEYQEKVHQEQAISLDKERTIMQMNTELMRDINLALKAIANGDLKHVVTTHYQGEFDLIPKYLNETIYTLKKIIQKIRGIGEIVQQGVREIADGNKELNRRTEEQSISISQTASSMVQFAKSVQETANQARDASELAHKASGSAEQGGQVMIEVSEAMSNINLSSGKIVNIISVIDEIAFQTNLLALNAAVEAARAGEQGRGFAVVAAEVRNLAQRSAQAAKEIKNLIQDSVAKVSNGTQLVDEAKQRLDEIVQTVKVASEMINVIANECKDQSDRIANVNTAIYELEFITQKNAALVEEATTASTAIDEHAKEMMSLLETFEIDNNENELSEGIPSHNFRRTIRRDGSLQSYVLERSKADR